MSNVFVQLRIPSRNFADVQLGTPVDVQLNALPGQAFRGDISRISGQADPLTGNVIVFAKIENEAHLLRPGLSCEVRVSLPVVSQVLTIPVAAVADNSGTPVVTVIRDGKAYETEVQTGIETRELVQVRKGLAAGDIVATAGGYGLPTGTLVTVSNGK